MNIQALMKQAQNMQKDMLKVKNEIDNTKFSASSSLVNVVVNGKKEIISIKIDKGQQIESDEIEMLEDMIMVALNDAFKQVDKLTEEKMGKFNGIPGLF